jgi:hypothetical protein
LQHPADVRWAAAFGDSITAAFAARATLFEDRDISWSIGDGTAAQLTLPWLISQYSGGVNGTSTKAVIPNDVTHLPKGMPALAAPDCQTARRIVRPVHLQGTTTPRQTA